MLELTLIQISCTNISITIANTSSNYLIIESDVILLDGFTSNKFQIIDANSGKSLAYLGRMVKYHPEEIELLPYGKTTSALDLTEAYDLEHNHIYEITYKTVAFIKNEILELSGNVIFNYDCEI